MIRRLKAADALLAILLCVAFAAPVAGAWYLHIYQDPISQVAGRQEAVFSSLTRVELDGARPAAVQLSWTTERGLVAPNWTGTVTAVSVAPGDTIQEGAVVAEIDGVDRIAAETASPFYRPLAQGSQGDDVQDLNNLLSRLGLRHGGGKAWTTSTSDGVAALQRRLGLQPPSPAQFDPAWVVWLPRNSLTAGSVELSLGGPAPGPGTQFLTPAAVLSDGLLVEQDTSSLTLDSGDAWRFTTETGVNLPVVVDSSGVGRVADLPALNAAVSTGTESVNGQVAYSQPVTATAVPVPAVVTAKGGDTCLWLAPRTGDLQPWPVTVIDGDVSATYVSETPPAGVKVLVNPAATMPDAPRC
jgi:hypothetical protein